MIEGGKAIVFDSYNRIPLANNGVDNVPFTWGNTGRYKYCPSSSCGKATGFVDFKQTGILSMADHRPRHPICFSVLIWKKFPAIHNRNAGNNSVIMWGM